MYAFSRPLFSFCRRQKDTKNIQDYLINKYPNLPIINKLIAQIVEHESVLETDRPKIENSKTEAYNLKEKEN